MASSFKKKSTRGRLTYPAGTKVSLHNKQLLISSGIPSLDTVLGEMRSIWAYSCGLKCVEW